MVDREFLSRVEFFADLSNEELDQLAGIGQSDTRSPGERVYTEGERATDLCLVVRGAVELRYELPGRESSKEHTLATVAPSEVFGWSALVPPFTLTLSSYCGPEGATILRFPGRLLTGVFEREPRIGYICMRNLSRVIANRFRRMEDEVARLEGLNLMHQW